MANTACTTEEAEKAYKAAEKCFILGDIDGAIRWASPLSSSHRDLGNALAAYEVHATAALFPSRGENWSAVLGMDKLPASAVTQDEVKKRYRRLCLVLHPDKNRSAAADGAFKLIRQAWEELNVPTRPDPVFWTGRSARAAGRSSSRSASPDPSDEWSERFGIPRDWWKEKPRQETGSDGDSSRPAGASSSSSRSRSWQPRYASRHGPIYCGHCNWGCVEEEDETQDDDESDERCHSCGGPFRRPQQSRAAEEEEATDDQSPGTDAEPLQPQSPIFMDEEEDEVPPPPPGEEAAPRPPSSPIFMEEDEEEEVPPPPLEEEEAAPPPPPEPIFMEEEEEEVPPPPPPPPSPSQPMFMDENEEEEAPPTPPPRAAPPRRRNGRYFPCPGQCRRCGARFSSTVSVGTWHVSCKLCHLPAKRHEIY